MRWIPQTLKILAATAFAAKLAAAPPPSNVPERSSTSKNAAIAAALPPACNDLQGRRVLLDDAPAKHGVELAFSANYRSRPCFVPVGGRVEVQVLVPEWNRPARIVLRPVRPLLPASALEGFGISGGGKPRDDKGSRPGIEISPPKVDPNTRYFEFLAGDMVLELPKLAPLKRGAMIGQTLTASPCTSMGWLVYLEFADGSRSAPVGGLIGDCGEPGLAPGVRGVRPE
jgi:hypothetical protein